MITNKKGFTLVEVLGTIIIIGILSTIAITATNQYLKDSRLKSYRIMSESVYEAATNCMIEGKCIVGVYDVQNLVNWRYLQSLKNPNSSMPNCSGSVSISVSPIDDPSSSVIEYNTYKYEVTLNCQGVTDGSETLTWPDEKIKDKK